MRYVWEHSDWPNWHSNLEAISSLTHCSGVRVRLITGPLDFPFPQNHGQQNYGEQGEEVAGGGLLVTSLKNQFSKNKTGQDT
jgi:hypothetical protein